MRTHLAAFLLAAALLACAPHEVRAAWRGDGSPVAARAGAVIAANDRGGVFAATGYPDRFTQVYQMSVDGDSVSGWSRAGRDLTPGLSLLDHNTTAPLVMLPDGDGGMYLLTAEQIGYAGRGGFLYPVQFFVHRRSGDGNPAPGWTPQGVLVSSPVVDHTFEVRHLPTMVPDGQGGVLVGWLYHLTTEFPDPPLWVQRVTGAGIRAWGDDGLVVQAGPGVATLPTLLADESGGAFVFWGQWDESRTSLRVFGQHVTASGQPAWSIGGRPVSSGAFDRVDQAAPADGGWVRQFYSPAIAAIHDGEHGALLGWSASTGADLDVFATRVGPDASLPWSGDRVLCSAPGEQASVACAGAGRAGAVFAWRDGRGGDDVSLRAQLISRHGRLQWDRGGTLIAEGPGNRGPLAIVEDGRDAHYFAWADPRLGGRVFAQRLLRNGHRSPFWARNGTLLSTHASGGPNTASPALRMVRTSRGHAVAVWSDATLGSLAMLLTPQGPAAVPAEPALAGSASNAPGRESRSQVALGVVPDPATSSGTLLFTLPAPERGSIELFDLAGRRMWARDVSALGAGEHSVPLTNGARLPAGVYLARLAHGTTVVTRRVVVLE